MIKRLPSGCRPRVTGSQAVRAADVGARVIVRKTRLLAAQYSYTTLSLQLRLHGSLYSCVEGTHAVVLVTGLKQFRQPDLARIRGLRRMWVLFDGRTIYDFAELSAQGFLYHGIGTASGGAL